jgi:ElaB/YqjD/DUF883 family membrane-anchored ribosome-binding protein
MPEITELASRAASAAKKTSQQALGAAQQQTRQLAESAQRYIRENPLTAVSYSAAAVFGLGVLIGRLLAPSGYDAASVASAARESLPRWRDAVRDNSQEWREATREKAQELLGTAQERSREILDATQEYAAEHPLRTASSVAIALLGLALAMGLFSSGGRHDS